MKCLNGHELDSSDAFCGECGAPAPRAPAGADPDDGLMPDDSPGGPGDPTTESVAVTSMFASGPAATGGGEPEPGLWSSPPVQSQPSQPLQASPRPVVPARSAGPARPQYGSPVSANQEAGFRLAMGERILKQYETVVLRPGLFLRKRGQGVLYVTDARLVFYSWVFKRGAQRASYLIQEAKLADISGMYAYVSRRISTGLLLLITVCGLATLGTLVTFIIPGVIIFAILTALFVILLIRDMSRRGSVGVTITQLGTGASSIEFGRAPQRKWSDTLVAIFMFPILLFLRSYSAADVLLGDPGADAEELLRELGALVLDLQAKGSLAYSHWGITAAPSPLPESSDPQFAAVYGPGSQ